MTQLSLQFTANDANDGSDGACRRESIGFRGLHNNYRIPVQMSVQSA